MNARIPETPTLKDLEAAAIRFARGAGEVVHRYRPGDIHVDFKGKGTTDPVTEADLKVEEYLREQISREFPDHAIVAEESAESAGSPSHVPDFVWAVDPVDGTANFAAGFSLYAVSIGLLYRGIPVVGSLFLPPTFAGEGVYHARAGGGAFLDETPLKTVSNLLPQPTGLAGVPGGFGRGFSFKGKKGEHFGELRVMGSIACEMVMVASGAFQFSLLTGSHVWDVAAGVVLVREAGGEVLEWRNGRWNSFDTFLRNQQANEDIPHALRHWGAPLLVGPPGIVRHLASRTRVRRRPLTSLRRRIQAVWGRKKSRH